MGTDRDRIVRLETCIETMIEGGIQVVEWEYEWWHVVADADGHPQRRGPCNTAVEAALAGLDEYEQVLNRESK